MLCIVRGGGYELLTPRRNMGRDIKIVVWQEDVENPSNFEWSMCQIVEMLCWASCEGGENS